MKVVREGLSEKVTVKLRTERFEGASHVKGLGGELQAKRTLRVKC